MKAIILAAGQGTRLAPLTDTTPKPLLKIMGKPIIVHTMEVLADYVDEIIIVTKYLADQFPATLGESFAGIPLSYHMQGEEAGTGAALFGLRSDIDVFLCYGDSMVSRSDLETILQHPGYACMTKQVPDPSRYGICQLSELGNITRIIEKPEQDVGNLANAGIYKLPGEIFDALQKIDLSSRGEYELTDAVNLIAEDFPIKPLPITGYYADIGYAWNIQDVHRHFLENLTDSEIRGEIEEGVTIKGNIILEEGAVIRSGSYIEGNCYIGAGTVIGPNAYLRGESVIGSDSKIGFCVECKNSTIGDHSNIAHLSYIGDSIVGNHVNLGGGFKVANLRHDRKNIQVVSKDTLIDTGKQKFGAIIADGVHTGINTLVYPGRTLGTNTMTVPGEIIK